MDLVIVIALAGALGACGSPGQTPLTGQATIVVTADAAAEPIPKEVFGSNIQWEHNGDGLLLRHQALEPVWNENLTEAVTALAPGSLRFPGGLLANTYEWDKGIGPPEQRKPNLSFSGEPQPSNFGTDEFLRVCRMTGAKAVITVNAAEGAEAAANWVEYVNGSTQTRWGARRAENVPGADGVRFWEIGNELYSPDTRGHRSASDYGRSVIEFAEAMKARDPNILVGAHLEASFLQAAWMANVYPHLLTWNEEVLKVCGQSIDFVVLHFYVPFDTMSDSVGLRRLVGAGPDVFDENLAIIERLVDTYCSRDTFFAVTEYGTYYDRSPAVDKRIDSTENALFLAAMLFRFMQNDRIRLAHNWSLVNNGAFGLLQSDGNAVRLTPAARVFERLTKLAGAVPLRMQIDTPTFSVGAKGNVPAMEAISSVEAFAVTQRSNGEINVVVLNRDPISTVPATVRAQGWSWPDSLEVIELVPSAPDSAPRFEQTVHTSLQAENDTLNLTLRPGSILFIRVPQATDPANGRED